MGGEVLGFLATILGVIAVVVMIVVTALTPTRPRRGSYVVPQPPGDRPLQPPAITAPAPMFHSKYCGGRYGSPCDCKGPHA